jgi:anti-anti-sigma factor
MKIDAARNGGAALLQLEGRLDREWAEHLSNTLEDLLQEGVRTLCIDFTGVTYVSTAATRVLARWQQELAVLRGEVQLTSLSPAVRETFAHAGWDAQLETVDPASAAALRHSSWHTAIDLAASGQYEMSACASPGTLTCRLHGDPGRLASGAVQPEDCSVVSLPDGVFGVGLGAIGQSYEECGDRLGELVAVAGCVAYFPTDGARMADYLEGGERAAPRAMLATGLTCEGDFSHLLRFSTKGEAESIPLSELAATALRASGGKVAGLVIAGETAGLCGARLRRSPASGAAPIRFDVPAVREWLSFAPERIHPMTTVVIAGVVARAPTGPLAAHLRPLGGATGLHGHLHAAVFSYHPLPQRTVQLGALLKGLFANHQLRDVLHLLRDNRGEAGVGESALVRGVCWVAPITQTC